MSEYSIQEVTGASYDDAMIEIYVKSTEIEYEATCSTSVKRSAWPARRSRRRESKSMDVEVQTDICWVDGFIDVNAYGSAEVSSHRTDEAGLAETQGLGASAEGEDKDVSEWGSCVSAEDIVGRDDDIEEICGECESDSSESEDSETRDCRCDLCTVEAREKRYKMRNGITMDPGAGDNVMPRRMVNKRMIVPSPGPKRGLKYVSCTGHQIPNEGQITLPFTTKEGHKKSWTFQIADTNKPLGCVADRVDDRCRVVFDKDDETGEDVSRIHDKSSGTMTRMRRTGKTWKPDAIVEAKYITDTKPVFSRQG